MDIRRIKFAWARGARLLTTGRNPKPLDYAMALEFDQDYDIHPDDEHLQYGPISTALRNYVFGMDYDVNNWRKAIQFCYDELPDLNVPAYQHHWVLLILFMIEYLADEGL